MTMISAKELYQSQQNLRRTQEDLYHLREDIANELRYASRNSIMAGDEWERAGKHPEVVALSKKVDELEAGVAAQEKEIGGKVYRVPDDNYATFEKKVAKLNRKATKLNCEPITFKIAESDEEERKIEGTKRLVVWNYIVLSGSTPMVPGYRFIAALDHTVREKDGDPVIVKQVPRIEEELDLSAWRYADPRCEHCNKIRSRNTTYLVEEIATGKVSKVGSSCLSDFTGANDPHRVASYLEYLVEFLEETSEEGESYSGGRAAYLTSKYLTHIAACIRKDGWTPRSMSNFATADQGWQNMRDYGKREKDGTLKYVEITAEDDATALAAIEWAKSLEGTTDFEHNLKTMAGLEFMPEKGDGIVAYIVQGYVKDETKRKEREAEQKRREEEREGAEPISEGRQEITGRIIHVYERTDEWGTHLKMTVLDDRGFRVNGTKPKDLWGAKEGDRVTFTATVKPKDGDEFYGWYKRPSKGQIIEKVAA